MSSCVVIHFILLNTILQDHCSGPQSHGHPPVDLSDHSREVIGSVDDKVSSGLGLIL